MVPHHHTAVSTLRYRLSPDEEAIKALEATFADYDRMMQILDEIAQGIGANLVTLHTQAYEPIRKQTRLPARLVSLGFRDRADYRSSPVRRLPLDDKLFAIKGPTVLTISTVLGRVTIPFDIAGYTPGWGHSAPAYLMSRDGIFEIHFGVTPRNSAIEEKAMSTDNILSRMGRLIAGIAHSVIDAAEDANKVALVEQAIREISAAEDETRANLGKAQAEEYRLKARQREIKDELDDLTVKIQTALKDGREDLATAGIGRQIDLESQSNALAKALDDTRETIEENQNSFQAVVAARKDAESRLADLKKSLSSTAPAGREDTPSPYPKAERASRAIERVTGVPSDQNASSQQLDELNSLHRNKQIAERLQKFRSGL